MKTPTRNRAVVVHGLLAAGASLMVGSGGLAAQVTPPDTTVAVPAAVASAQVQDATQEAELIAIAYGSSAVVSVPGGLRRVSIASPDIADAVVVSETEVVVNGKAAGATSLLIWGNTGGLKLYTVRVSADSETLQAEYRRLFPGEDIRVSSVGNSVVLTGEVTNAVTRRQAVALAGTLGEDVQVLDHLGVPDQGQILLKVRFAEVSRSAMDAFGGNILHINPLDPRGDDEAGLNTGGSTPFTRDFRDGDGPEQTFSDAVNFYVFNNQFNIAAFIRALRGQGMFRSLAEPNLLALPGEEATFLAGGEFPFPVVQGSGANTAISVIFKEFGIRLAFTPEITNSGAIRLDVEPEVSALDFANGLQISGFRIPSLTSRKAHTVVELEPGQTFAIAGLLDNSLVENVNKVPLLGDIPLLGNLFKSKDMQQSRTELLVLVTPVLVRPSNVAPEVPTGEPETWDRRNLSGKGKPNGNGTGN